MNFKPILAAFVLLVPVVIYQQCSVGGSEGGLGNLSSSSHDTPSLTLDSLTANLPSTATTFQITGSCNVIFVNYVFSLAYQASNATTATSLRVNSACTGGRFSLTVKNSDLHILNTSPGNLSVNIIVITPTGELAGQETLMHLQWQASRPVPPQEAQQQEPQLQPLPFVETASATTAKPARPAAIVDHARLPAATFMIRA